MTLTATDHLAILPLMSVRSHTRYTSLYYAAPATGARGGRLRA